jgi:hypothetical protein
VTIDKLHSLYNEDSSRFAQAVKAECQTVKKQSLPQLNSNLASSSDANRGATASNVTTAGVLTEGNDGLQINSAPKRDVSMSSLSRPVGLARSGMALLTGSVTHAGSAS